MNNRVKIVKQEPSVKRYWTFDIRQETVRAESKNWRHLIHLSRLQYHSNMNQNCIKNMDEIPFPGQQNRVNLGDVKNHTPFELKIRPSKQYPKEPTLLIAVDQM